MDRGLGSQPRGQGSWGGGALADPFWSLVKQVQNPFSREKRRYGLKGYMGVGAAGPLAGQGRVGFLGTRNPPAGVVRGGLGRNQNSTQTHSQW